MIGTTKLEKSVIKLPKGGTRLMGEYEVGSDPYLARVLAIISILSDLPTNILNVKFDSRFDQVLELITFLGGRVDYFGSQCNILWSQKPMRGVPAGICDDPDVIFILFMCLLFMNGKASMQFARFPKLVRTEITKLIEPLASFKIKLSEDSGFVEAEVTQDKFPVEFFSLSEKTGHVTHAITACALSVFRFTEPVRIPLISDRVFAFALLCQGLGAKCDFTEHGFVRVGQGIDKVEKLELVVPENLSEAIFVLMASTILAGDVQIKGITTARLVGITHLLQKWGVNFRLDGSTIRVWGTGVNELKPADIQVGDYPQLNQTYAAWAGVVASGMTGESVVSDEFSPQGINFAAIYKKFGIECVENIGTGGNIVRKLSVFGPSRKLVQKVKLEPTDSVETILAFFLGVTNPSEVILVDQGFIPRFFPELLTKLSKIGLLVRLEANE